MSLVFLGIFPTMDIPFRNYGGVDIKIHVFLTSALVGDEWSASCP
jgi:hypothetical protein